MKLATGAGFAILVTVVAAAVSRSPTEAQAQSSRRPNILVIVADDMGYADLGVHGSRDMLTPNIDRLASEGVRFTDAYVSGPYCSPTRAGLLTGRYPQRFGHEFNIDPVVSDAGLPVTETTIADRLKAGGYRTAVFGKWHLGMADKFHPLRRGFEEFFGFLGGAHSYVAVGPDSNQVMDGTKPVGSIDYLTDALADRAAAYIEQHADQPFFLYLAFNAAHTPLEATEKYLARFPDIKDPRRRSYAAMVSALDDGVGKALAVLHKHNLDRNTLVFFFNDNGGPMMLNTGINGSSNAPLRGAKRTTWEGGIRVPFIIRWTGQLPAGRIDHRPIIQLDVMPTALAAAGVPIEKSAAVDGVNLLPFLTGDTTGVPHDALYWRLGGMMAIRRGQWKLVKTREGPFIDADPGALRDLSSAELFNLAEDISETKNLAVARPDKVKELSDVWQRWNGQLAKPLWPPMGRPGQ